MSEYSPEERERIVSYVCSQLSLGRSMKKIFEEDREREKLCDVSVFYAWRSEDTRTHEKVARARASGLEVTLEELPAIADDKVSDPDAQSRRVRIYARERMAAMLAPALYGAKVDVTSGGKPLPPAQNVTLIDNRVQSILMLVQQRKDLAKLLE